MAEEAVEVIGDEDNTPICPSCGKRMTASTAVGSIWHAKCETCGETISIGELHPDESSETLQDRFVAIYVVWTGSKPTMPEIHAARSLFTSISLQPITALMSELSQAPEWYAGDFPEWRATELRATALEAGLRTRVGPPKKK